MDHDPWQRLHDEPRDTWRESAEKDAEPFRRRNGGAGGRFRAVAVVGVVVVCLAFLVGGGYLLFGTGSEAEADQRYLADLSVTEVLSAVEQEGFTCIPGRTIAQCEKSIQGADLSVTVHFEGETEVTMLEASGGTAAYADQEVDPAELRGFFEMAAALPLPTDSTAVDAARTWAGEHVGKGGAKTFEGVRYEASADQPLLKMRSA